MIQAVHAALTVLCCLALTLGARPQTPTDAPPDDGLEQCRSCEGTGLTEVDCSVCEGSGEFGCRLCTSAHEDWFNRHHVAHIRLDDPEKADQAVALIAEYRENTEKLRSMGFAMGPVPPGKLPCPASCIIAVRGSRKPLPCKFCDGEQMVRCDQCKGKGVAKCWNCLGRKRAKSICPRCVGSGRALPVALAPEQDVTRCPWCDGAPSRPCGACVEGGPRSTACPTCGEQGKQACTDCRGTGFQACRQCRARGKVVVLDSGGRSQEHPCAKCSRAGKVACTKCRRGIVECERCNAPENAARMCLTCFGKQKTFCRGCYEGSSLAWEWTADAFRADEAQREAVRWFAEGIERERARTGPLIDRFAGTEKEREAHKAALRVVELRMQGKHDRSRQDLEK